MSTDDASHDRIQELIPLLIDLEQKLDCEMNLESLARQCGYSPFHFHRFFSGEIGQTPKRYVHRLRLERAAYKLAITGESILQIALSVGFNNHETLSREFKRAFGCSPREYRKACRVAQTERLERNRGFRGDRCFLSDVRFVSLPPMTLLAVRRHGAYATCPIPFQAADSFWSDLARWAKRKNIVYRSLPIAISYDDPTVTPDSLQRLDACVPVESAVAAQGRIRCLDFAGGPYGGIEHTGPLSTIDQAYRNLADGIRRSPKYDFDLGPPLQIYRNIAIGGDSSANLTEVYFPLRNRR